MKIAVLLIALLLACAYGADNVRQLTFTFEKDKTTSTQWLSPLGIGDYVNSIALNSPVTLNVSVCIMPWLAAPDDQWSHKCYLYAFFPLQQLASELSFGSFPLAANVKYTVSVATTAANKLDNVTVNLVGTKCADSHKMPPDCAGVLEMGANVNWTDYNAIVDLSVPSNQDLLVRTPEIPSNYGNVTFTINQQLAISYAVNAVPPAATVYQPVTVVEYPLPGFYYLRFHNAGATQVDFKLTVTALPCVGNKVGVRCQDDIEELNTDTAGQMFTSTVNSQHPKYYKLSVINSTVWVNVMKVAADNVTGERDPKIWIQYGNLPSEPSHIAHGCTKAKCPNVNTVKLSSVNGTFYVAVLANNLTLGYDIWANTMCPFDCYSNMGNGQCITDDTKSNFGQCQCNIGWAGPDCNTSIGLTIEYIVLIVIGSLVVLSAIIGFIAWAYMRRKHTQYDQVS